MSQNAQSYDRHAAEWQARLKAGNNSAHRFLEKPAMLAKLPDLSGKTVLCIGCGSGEELGMLLLCGAEVSGIHGIDISANLIDSAQAAYPEARFSVMGMEALRAFPPDSFDFVYSSLTLHYAPEWGDILRQVARILKIGGTCLFSTHHPVKWGGEVRRGAAADSFFMGYTRPKEGTGQPGLDGMPSVQGDYQGSRKIQDTWFGNMNVEYYHRPMAACLRDILASGMTMTDFLEPVPTEECRELNPAFYAIHSKIPLFMIFELRRDV